MIPRVTVDVASSYAEESKVAPPFPIRELRARLHLTMLRRWRWRSRANDLRARRVYWGLCLLGRLKNLPEDGGKHPALAARQALFKPSEFRHSVDVATGRVGSASR